MPKFTIIWGDVLTENASKLIYSMDKGLDLIDIPKDKRLAKNLV